MFNNIRGAIRFDRARAALQSGNISLAVSHIDEAKRLIGGKINKPAIYDFNLIAAEIYLRHGDNLKAIRHLDIAEPQIRAYSKLSKIEREYLLDYCDLFRIEIEQSDRKMEYRVDRTQYRFVNDQLCQRFPIKWDI